MATSEYIKRYLDQAKKEHKKAKESWLEDFFKAFYDQLKDRSIKASPGDKYVVAGAFATALNSLIPEGLDVIREVGIKKYIDLPAEKELSDLLSRKRVDFAIEGKNTALLIEFKTNVQFNDVSAAMVEMMAVKKFYSAKTAKAVSTASLHLFPYRTNVAGLRLLNSTLGNPLDNIWIFCTPELEFDTDAIRAFRKGVRDIVG